jgi:hypothetical protein
MPKGLLCLLRSSACCGAIGLCATLAAQQPAAAPVKEESAKPALEFHGSFRTRLEMWDWFGTGDASQYAFSGNLLRLSVGKTGERMNWKAEVAAPVLLMLPEDAQEPGARGQLGLGGSYYAANQQNRNAGMVFPKQVYVHWHHLGESKRHGIRLGRFEFLDGSEAAPTNATLAALKRTRVQQRILGAFGWTHVGRSLDGAHYTYDAPGRNLTLIGATPTRGVFQTDGWGWNRVAFAYGAYTQQMPHTRAASEVRLMGMYYTDWRNVVKTDNRPLAVRNADRERIQIGSYGAHLLHARETRAGTVDFLVWGLLQSGTWGQQSHLAGAATAEIGWQPAGLPMLKPWLRAGYFRSTGDKAPDDGKHTTFFQLMPTPRPYARFPFFNMVNNEDIHAGVVLRPHSRVSISSEAHFLSLAAREDLWYLGGGVFQPWTFGYVGRPSMGARTLASLFDVSADVKFSDHFSINAYYGYALRGDVTAAIYPDGKNGAFGLLEATFTF